MIRVTPLVLTLLLVSPPAAVLAQTPAPKHDAMHDAMKHDATAKHSAMKHDAMKHDAPAKHNSMKHDAMKHGAMAKPTSRP